MGKEVFESRVESVGLERARKATRRAREKERERERGPVNARDGRVGGKRERERDYAVVVVVQFRARRRGGKGEILNKR